MTTTQFVPVFRATWWQEGCYGGYQGEPLRQFADSEACVAAADACGSFCVPDSPACLSLIQAAIQKRVDLWLGTPSTPQARTLQAADQKLSQGITAPMRYIPGEWHPATDVVLATHHVCQSLVRQSMSAAQEAVRAHPLYPSLSFLGISPASAALLLATIRDPRWHRDLDHPDRITRLQSYLQVLPKHVQAAVTAGENVPVGEGCTAANLLVHVTTHELNGYFPRAAGTHAIVRDLQHLLKYVQLHWLELLRVTPHPELLFSPDAWFQRRPEAQRAYLSVVARS